MKEVEGYTKSVVSLKNKGTIKIPFLSIRISEESIKSGKNNGEKMNNICEAFQENAGGF